MMLSNRRTLCRRLARKYHPDKNPAGRERFVAVQKAYERLQAGAAAGQGPQSWRLLLILKVMFHLSICLSSQKLLTLQYIIVPGRFF